MTLGLSDSQLRYVTVAAQPLPVKSDGGVNRHPSDADIETAVRTALHCLVQVPAVEVDPA